MLKTRSVTKQVEEIEDIICNVCGKSAQRGGCDFEGIVEYELKCGYGSELGDGKSFHFTICDVCMRDKVFPLFKIPPLIFDVNEEVN